MAALDPTRAAVVDMYAERGMEVDSELWAEELAAARYGARDSRQARAGATTGGLPYPDPADPAAEGANAIRALAEALGPIPLTAASVVALNANFTFYHTARFYALGALIWGRFALQRKSGAIIHGETMGTVQEAYRPGVSANDIPIALASLWQGGNGASRQGTAVIGEADGRIAPLQPVGNPTICLMTGTWLVGR